MNIKPKNFTHQDFSKVWSIISKELSLLTTDLCSGLLIYNSIYTLCISKHEDKLYWKIGDFFYARAKELRTQIFSSSNWILEYNRCWRKYRRLVHLVNDLCEFLNECIKERKIDEFGFLLWERCILQQSVKYKYTTLGYELVNNARIDDVLEALESLRCIVPEPEQPLLYYTQRYEKLALDNIKSKYEKIRVRSIVEYSTVVKAALDEERGRQHLIFLPESFSKLEKELEDVFIDKHKKWLFDEFYKLLYHYELGNLVRSGRMCFYANNQPGYNITNCLNNINIANTGSNSGCESCYTKSFGTYDHILWNNSTTTSNGSVSTFQNIQNTGDSHSINTEPFALPSTNLNIGSFNKKLKNTISLTKHDVAQGSSIICCGRKGCLAANTNSSEKGVKTPARISPLDNETACSINTELFASKVKCDVSRDTLKNCFINSSFSNAIFQSIKTIYQNLCPLSSSYNTMKSALIKYLSVQIDLNYNLLTEIESGFFLYSTLRHLIVYAFNGDAEYLNILIKKMSCSLNKAKPSIVDKLVQFSTSLVITNSFATEGIFKPYSGLRVDLPPGNNDKTHEGKTNVNNTHMKSEMYNCFLEDMQLIHPCAPDFSVKPISIFLTMLNLVANKSEFCEAYIKVLGDRMLDGLTDYRAELILVNLMISICPDDYIRRYKTMISDIEAAFADEEAREDSPYSYNDTMHFKGQITTNKKERTAECSGIVELNGHNWVPWDNSLKSRFFMLTRSAWDLEIKEEKINLPQDLLDIKACIESVTPRKRLTWLWSRSCVIVEILGIDVKMTVMHYTVLALLNEQPYINPEKSFRAEVLDRFMLVEILQSFVSANILVQVNGCYYLTRDPGNIHRVLKRLELKQCVASYEIDLGLYYQSGVAKIMKQRKSVHCDVLADEVRAGHTKRVGFSEKIYEESIKSLIDKGLVELHNSCYVYVP